MGFRKDFLWGTATASAQIEGAVFEGGKTSTIWDDDSIITGYIVKDENPKIACDHYHRFRDDVAIMKEIGLKSYRFSISWARIIPNDDGKINQEGVGFYRELLNELQMANIEPICTLYHWDMPMWLYRQGGWKNSIVVEKFIEYTKAVVEMLSDKIKYWITFNEPQCFVNGGYQEAWHAPFEINDVETVENITRNVMLAHGKAVKVIRQFSKKESFIGFAPTANVFIPTTDGTISEEKAKELTFSVDRGQAMSSAWWSDPIVLGKIPGNMGFLTEEDIKEIHQPLDFYAYNIYTSENHHRKETQGDLFYVGMPRTANGWTIFPQSIYYATKFFYERYKLPILISENGTACFDLIYSDGKVHDPKRIEYIKLYLKELMRAVVEGVDVIGYQYWSLMDNFEWTVGYDIRFGLVYMDYKTQERILKDSAYYYKEIIKTNGEILNRD